MSPKVLAPIFLCLAAVCAGCATTAPEAKFSQPMAPDARIRASDSADVTIQAADTVKASPGERDRVIQKIKARIEARKATNSPTAEPRSFQVELFVSRYEKGSAVARFMLAGTGQIHLDGTISVYQMPQHTLLEKFDMQKTFAWGGVYGGMTTIEQIEDTFADSVAATVTGQAEAKADVAKGAH